MFMNIDSSQSVNNQDQQVAIYTSSIFPLSVIG